MKTEKFIFENSAGLKLSSVLDYPDEGEKFPCLIQAHGFTSAKDRAPARKFAAALVEAGIASFRFDFTGHGESEGKFEEMTVSQQVDDLKCAYKFVRNLPAIDPDQISLFGSSLGGMTAILAAPDLNIKTLHLRAPVSDFLTTRSRLIPEMLIAKWKQQGFLYENELYHKDIPLPENLGKKLNYSYYEDGLSHDCYQAAENIKAPTLIFHGTDDKSVPLSQSQELMKHLGGKKNLEIFEGQTHGFNDEYQEKIRRLSIDWLKRNH